MNIKRTYIDKILALALLLLLAWPAQAQTIAEMLEYPFAVKHQKLHGGNQIAYTDQGSGSAVILIHGLGSYMPAWKQTIPALSKNHRVIVLDLPGYGKSYKDVQAYSIPFFAQTVAELQDSLGIDQAVWAGHSMGGQIAIDGAAQYGDKISRLVLIAPAGFEAFTDQEAVMMKQYVTPASIQATPEAMIRQTFKATFFKFPETAKFMADDRVAIRGASDFGMYARAYAGSVAAMLEGPVLGKLDQLSMPALVIFGREDALIPNQQLHPDLTTTGVAESGKQKIPGSTLEMVDSAGHFVQFEQPETVNELILNFLNK